MKLREKINNNASEFIGSVYEHDNKIHVRKSDNRNWNCNFEVFEFETIADFENWKKEQTWIKKVEKISEFKKVGL